ncbi:[Fe-Fe] hydrogenase large subunit C-terminal domain-containing protein [Treponema saccharophilum]|uniref:[Fe-Fe] hydrogenase large subunit C-terminal domain-containing protein n=1 Tax=Treponema saccharophilum TaxID=165 RepID=UPI00386A9F07
MSINHDLCIGCGTCIDACVHGARTGIDDMPEFFRDLKSGISIVAIVAPAVAVNFSGKDLNLNGWLKSVGVRAVFDVAFGAELTTKSYVEQIKKENPMIMISQPCPALVSFIEIYRPQLIQYLAKADSPMAHTVECIRHFYPEYRDCRIAVISPCFAKRREFDENGRGDYNVTMKNLDLYFREHNIDLTSYPQVDYDNPLAERAVLYSTPGGLMRTAERFVPGISSKTRKIEGQPAVFEYLAGLDRSLSSGCKPYYQLVDCLNCEKGCNRGGGSINNNMPLDELEDLVESRARARQEKWRTGGKPNKFALRKLEKTVNAYWKPAIYERVYQDRSVAVEKFIKEPNESELQQLYESMGKHSKSDIYNCGACGYNSCEQMAVAIFNGLNRKENCHHYVMNLANQDHEKEIREAMNSITEAVRSGSEALQSNVRDLQEIRNMNMLTTEGIKKLNTKMNGIWDIVGIISNVADQTKIIAFNAELEASSSGEAGKNFHIVATEIRRLSDTIIDSIKEIKNIIDEIQNASDRLILDSEKGTRQIDASCENARSLERGFGSIMATSRASGAENAQEIKKYAGQVVSSGGKIFDTLQQIAHGIEEFSQNTSATSDS